MDRDVLAPHVLMPHTALYLKWEPLLLNCFFVAFLGYYRVVLVLKGFVYSRYVLAFSVAHVRADRELPVTPQRVIPLVQHLRNLRTTLGMPLLILARGHVVFFVFDLVRSKLCQQHAANHLSRRVEHLGLLVG